MLLSWFLQSAQETKPARSTPGHVDADTEQTSSIFFHFCTGEVSKHLKTLGQETGYSFVYYLACDSVCFPRDQTLLCRLASPDAGMDQPKSGTKLFPERTSLVNICFFGTSSWCCCAIHPHFNCVGAFDIFIIVFVASMVSIKNFPKSKIFAT